MKILGIDYGDKKIGLALSDEHERLASRFLAIENRSLKKSIALIRIIVLSENVKRIIVGMPIGFKGESEQTRRTKNFIGKLRKSVDTSILEINEIFTSKMAAKNLAESGLKNIKEIINQESARIILQDYLDNKSSNRLSKNCFQKPDV